MSRIESEPGDNGGMERNPPPPAPVPDPPAAPLERALLERAIEEIAARPPEEAPEPAEAAAAVLSARLDEESPPASALRALNELLGAVPADAPPGD